MGNAYQSNERGSSPYQSSERGSSPYQFSERGYHAPEPTEPFTDIQISEEHVQELVVYLTKEDDM